MREIYIDSRRRTEPHGNSYTLHVQTPLKNVTRVDLVSATIPNSLYNITQGGEIVTGCSIAPGFYSVSSIVTAINDSLGGSQSLTFLSSEGKFMFYSANSFTLDILSSEFLSMSGFGTSNLVSNLGTTSNGVFTPAYIGKYVCKAPTVTNFKASGEYIYLDIEELRRPHAIDAVTDVYTSQSSTTFAVIPMDVSSGCIKTFKEHTDYSVSVEYPKPIDQIDRFTVHWRDFNGNLVNFNGVDENALILRVYEEERTPEPPAPEKTPDVVKFTRPDKRTVFVMLVLSLVFILFMKRRKS